MRLPPRYARYWTGKSPRNLACTPDLCPLTSTMARYAPSVLGRFRSAPPRKFAATHVARNRARGSEINAPETEQPGDEELCDPIDWKVDLRIERRHSDLVAQRELRVMRERGLLVRSRRLRTRRQKEWGRVEGAEPNLLQFTLFQFLPSFVRLRNSSNALQISQDTGRSVFSPNVSRALSCSGSKRIAVSILRP